MKKLLTALLFLVCSYILLMIIAKISSKPKKIKPFIAKLPAFAIVGHQGAPHKHPGNSMESFRETLKINPNAMLEMDVHQTKDGYIIVNHDKNLARTTKSTKKISELSLKEIQTLDAGYKISFDSGISFPYRGKGYKIPELETILKRFKGTLISIDIKHHTIECADRVIKLVIDNNALDNVIIGSFSNIIMDHVRKNYPGIATTFSQAEITKFFILHKLRLSGFFRAKDDVMMIPEFSDENSPEYSGPKANRGIRLITKKFIEDAKTLNLPVIAWTINKKTNMERLFKWEISGIITDYPDILNRICRPKK